MMTYGRREYVARAISVYQSYTYPNKELIIVDDSPEPLRVAGRDIKVINLKERTILGRKHNIGMEYAQGDLLVHHDDDDLYLPNRLVKQGTPIVTGEADLTGFQMKDMWNYDEKKCYRFGKRVVIVTPVKVTTGIYLAKFHDSTCMFHRRVWDASLQYTIKNCFEKADLINDAIRAGFKHLALENNGDFIYGRHSNNTWRIDRRLLAEVDPAPEYVMAQIRRYGCAS